MPSRNRGPNAAEFVSRSLNCTRAVSPCERSDMVNASHHCLRHRLEARRLMMNKSLRARGRESSRKHLYGFQLVRWRNRRRPKKRAAVSGGFEVDNREASNRVDRSHSVSKRGRPGYKRESLTSRKRAIFFRLCLPCRPLAQCVVPWSRFPVPHDLKKLLAASLDARFLVIATCSRSIS